MNPDKPKPVAVLMCVYNNDRADWFDAALQSIFDQSYGFANIRVYLAVDGPVSHHIEDVIAKHTESLHLIVRNDSNSGLAASLNKLIAALGDEEYIFRMDSDDLSTVERIQTQVAYLDLNPQIMILGTAIYEIDSAGNQIMTRTYPRDTAAISGYIKKASPFAHPTVCFRKAVFSRIQKYDLVDYNEDLCLWFKALSQNIEMANLDTPLYSLRVTDAFFKRRGLKKALSEFRLYVFCNLRLHGLGLYLLHPCLRLLLRLLPAPATRYIYTKGVRRHLNVVGANDQPHPHKQIK
ncbi:MAG: glycosyltransferase [Deltaproteobacteria bacterium]|nr:glycosyltransferase [Deltaproteobacteria bacterium]